VAGTLVLAAALAGFPLPSREEQAPAETLVRLTVHPMPAPKPALRHLLLPELKEMTPGNPIPAYLKCLMDQDFSTNQESLGRSALRQADRAARMDRPDWQLLDKLRADGINLLLPDVQKLRFLASELQGRFRDEVTAHRFDDALGTAKTMFALARHMGEHPTVIGGLVGIAIAYVTVAPLEELIQQPGCPNLYWALTNLPSPLVPLEKGFQGERMFILAEFRDLDDTAPMTPEQIRKLVAHIDRIRDFEPGGGRLKKTTRAYLAERTRDEKYLTAARRRLAEHGLPEERVAGFPADQVILLDELREYEVRRDEEMKLMNLPTWEFAARSARGRLRAGEPALFDFFLPTLSKVRLAQGRLEQRLALLRHVEALRMYAADHQGELPEKLAEIDVPLPADPFTGRPFRYTLDGGVAHLRGTPPPGEEKNPAYNLHYEIAIRK
jgi:hypothetical protein